MLLRCLPLLSLAPLLASSSTGAAFPALPAPGQDDLLSSARADLESSLERVFEALDDDRLDRLAEPIVRAENEWDVVQEETFAPILYIIRVQDMDDAIAKHNAVPQGLSSAVFTMNMRNAERFLSAAGSDCGIANVNIGTSGAEIGGAFGGEGDVS